MSSSDPIIFAARVASMSDPDLYAAFQSIETRDELTAFHQAVLDEVQIRGLITGSEADAVMATAAGRF